MIMMMTMLSCFLRSALSDRPVRLLIHSIFISWLYRAFSLILSIDMIHEMPPYLFWPLINRQGIRRFFIHCSYRRHGVVNLKIFDYSLRNELSTPQNTHKRELVAWWFSFYVLRLEGFKPWVRWWICTTDGLQLGWNSSPLEPECKIDRMIRDLDV